MEPTAGTTLRGDLNTVVEEAAAVDDLFIGLKVLPVWSVDRQSAQYPKLSLRYAQLLNIGASVRAPRSSYNRISRQYELDTYTTLDRGLEESIDDVERAALAPYFDIEANSAKIVLRAVRLDHEYRVAQTVLNPATLDAANSKVAYTEANIATIDFPADVLAAIDRVNGRGGRADTIVLSAQALARLQRSTLLQNWCRGAVTSDATLNLTADAIARAFAANGIRQVLVGRAVYNAANPGQGFSGASIWGTTYVLVCQTGEGDPRTGGIGRTLVWNEEGGIWVTMTYRDEVIRSEVVRVRQNTAEKITDATAGTLITTRWA